MRYGHRRSAELGFAVYLGMVPRDHLRIVADQEQAAHREAPDMPGLRNAGLLQQGQASAARPDKDELRRVGFRLAALQIIHLNLP
ncbi:hypothetical protein D3C73_1135360 [compost metagenome]